MEITIIMNYTPVIHMDILPSIKAISILVLILILVPVFVFMISLLMTRLGKNGSDELKAHRWFGGVDWSALRAVKAPHLPPGNICHMPQTVDVRYSPFHAFNSISNILYSLFVIVSNNLHIILLHHIVSVILASV